MFGVGVNDVKRYVIRQQQTGRLARYPIPGGPRRIGQEQEAWLRARLEAAPDATLAEHGAWWAEQHGQSVSVATMWRAPPRLGGTRTKKPRGAPRRRRPARPPPAPRPRRAPPPPRTLPSS